MSTVLDFATRVAVKARLEEAKWWETLYAQEHSDWHIVRDQYFGEGKQAGCSACDRLAKLQDEFTALDRIEVKGDEHERDTTGSGTTTEG